jgi:RimJ/RimL family protein N-acetyltransferase
VSEPIEFPIGGIDDGVVRVRFAAESDLEAIVDASLDPEIVRWTRVPADNDLETVRAWHAGTRAEDEGGRELHLIVTDAGSDALLGSIGMHRLSDEGECDLGYWVATPARGRGVATRAVRLLSGWLFDQLPVERIVIRTEPDNTASRAVAEAAGFSFEGVLRSYLVLDGIRRDAASYSLLRGEL